MQPFVLSALLSFAIYQFMAYVDVPPFRGWLRVGSVNINFGPAAARWAKRVLIAAITLLIVFGVLFVHERLSPLDAISRNRTNIVLGFLFGPLFAIWLNSVFNHPPGQPLSRGLVVGGVGLIVFCLIGSAGNQTGKLIQQLTRKISGFKGFGVEVSLSDPSRKRDSSQGALPLAGSKNSSNFESNNGSAGLGYVSQLGEIVDRDRRYLRDLFGQNNWELMLHLNRAEDLSNFALGPPMQCFTGWLGTTADATYVNDRLGLFLTTFRQVSTINDDERRMYVSRTFVHNLAIVASDIQSFGVPQAVARACLPLVKIFCSDAVDKDNTIHDDKRQSLMACLTRSRQEDGPPSKAKEDAVKALSDKLSLFVADKALETRPYFVIAYASLLVQLGQYAAAVAVLDSWLDKQRKRLDGKSDIVEDWFEIRVRSILAAYSEEWLLKQGTSAPRAYRNEHLENMGILRTNLHKVLLNVSFPLTTKDDPFKPPGPCTSAANYLLGLSQRLFASYVTTALTHIQNRLHHPDYKSDYLVQTDVDIEGLLRLDLSCLPKDPQPPLLIYAQILDAYALNMVQYVRATKDVISSDEKEDRLKIAARALGYGLEITNKPADDEVGRRGKVPFLERVAPSIWVSAQESLKQTKIEWNAASSDD
jgi:hypothetical protein